MKLKELVTGLIGLNNLNAIHPMDRDILKGDALESIRDKLMLCEEFSNVESLEIMHQPVVENTNGKVFSSNTFKLSDDFLFGKRVLLHSIAMGPEIYDPYTVHSPIRDGACITPIMYDPVSFKPKRTICIEFSPEEIQDNLIVGENKIKELCDLFKMVLESPEDYRVRGERPILVRGIFNKFSDEKDGLTEEMGTLILDIGEQTFFTASCIETTLISENELKSNLTQVFIPKRLKEKFMEEFSGVTLMSRMEVDNFLKKYDSI
jgi:hypothetical protein